MGGKLTSPNDVVVKSDGSIWFTDPDYGFLHPEFGHGDKPEQDRNRVFRVDGDTLAITVVSEDFDKPNGIAFSPDESVLYIGDTGRTHGEFRNHRVMRFDVTPRRRIYRQPDSVRRYRTRRTRRLPLRHRRQPLRLRWRWHPSIQPRRQHDWQDPHPRSRRELLLRHVRPPTPIHRRHILAVVDRPQRARSIAPVIPAKAGIQRGRRQRTFPLPRWVRVKR